jgi:hypothetical protein
LLKIGAAAAFGWLWLASPASQAQDADRQRVADDDKLSGLLLDQTVHGIYSDGGEWFEYHAADGRCAYWDGCSHPGQWWVTAGLVCYRYPGDPAKVDHCWYVYQTDRRIEFVYALDGPHGPVGAYSLEILPGNPEHLPLGRSDCLSAAIPGSSALNSQ